MLKERQTIQRLPIQLANQIAAGEVVERPASVVKELVENSLDAQATDLSIEIEKGGRRRIRVVDNGLGIPKEELELALSRHATSKIKTLDDLEAILSLGFRGEALASISSVARLTLTSQTEGQSSAYQAFCEGPEMAVQISAAAHPLGTSVDVEDLFFNTPARRKFLRTDKTEFSHIEETIKRIALAAPHASFRLKHNGKIIRHYPKLADGAEPLSRIARIVGARFAEEAVYFNQSYQNLRLEGWVSPGPVCRHQGDIQYFYVNQRMMRDRLLNHAVREAYGESLPADRQPSFVLYLTLPAQDVDVNVHPAKHEVRFHQARQVHDFILSTLRPIAFAGQVEKAAEYESLAKERHEYRPPNPAQYQQTEKQGRYGIEPAPEPRKKPSFSRPSRATAFFPAAAQKHPLVGEPTARTHRLGSAQQATPGWQGLALLDDWLLLKQGNELALAALDEIKTAAWLAELKKQVVQGLNGQPLLLPTQIEYPQFASFLAKYEGLLASLGVQLKLIKNNRGAVLHVPALLRHLPVERTLPELFDCLQQQDPKVAIQDRADVLLWLAQQDRQAIDLNTAQALWEQLGQDEQPKLQALPWQDYVNAK